MPLSAYKFEYDEKESIPYEKIDDIFTNKSVEEKIDFLKKLSSETVKNRFVHNNNKSLKKRFFRI